MLNITIQDSPSTITLCLEGKLSGAWVHELERVWRDLAGEEPDRQVTVNLNGVVFVDRKGKDLLGSMLQRGVRLEHARLLVKCIVDNLKGSQSTIVPQ